MIDILSLEVIWTWGVNFLRTLLKSGGGKGVFGILACLKIEAHPLGKGLELSDHCFLDLNYILVDLYA